MILRITIADPTTMYSTTSTTTSSTKVIDDDDGGDDDGDDDGSTDFVCRPCFPAAMTRAAKAMCQRNREEAAAAALETPP